ncbi:MAG: putative lipid II flippase FtsW [Candidatus Rariloculaceae bacterium]
MNSALEIRGFNLDAPSFAAIIALLVLGIIIMSSASISLADRDIGEPLFFFSRQLGAVFIGLLAALILTMIPTELWYRYHWVLLIACMLLLVSVFLPGFSRTVNGSTRWLDFGAISLQPSEPARVCLILYLGSYIVRQQASLSASLVGFLKPMIAVTVVSALLLFQPDFGAAVVVTLTSIGLLFIGGARIRDFVVAFCIASVALSALAYSTPYRMERLLGFLDPWADPYGKGFQLTQSLIAVGRGNWFGVGLGDSVQKLFYLPEAHTDFVFAVLAEELGFMGVTLTVLLFGVIVLRAIALGPKAASVNMPFHGLVSTGIAMTLGLQAFINMGVNTGMLPTKGLTLPLISYGRTSMVTTLISLGLLIRIQHEVQNEVCRRVTVRAQRKKKQ